MYHLVLYTVKYNVCPLVFVWYNFMSIFPLGLVIYVYMYSNERR